MRSQSAPSADRAAGLGVIRHRRAMIPKYKRHSIIGISVGMALIGGGLALAFLEIIPRGAGAVSYVVGGGIYIWGCLALAKAKGYSSAIVLTVFLGVLFPAVVLLALPDKNKRYGRRRRAACNEGSARHG